MRGSTKIAAASVGAITLIAGISGFCLYKSEPHLQLMKDVIKVEINSKSSEITKEDFLGSSINPHILKNVSMKTDYTEPNELKVYDVEFKYTTKYFKKSETVKGEIIVEDTTKPVFVDPKKEIVIEKNAQDVDLSKYFTAKDNSNGIVKIYNKTEIDFSKPGTYQLVMTAEDNSNNKTDYELTVRVVKIGNTKELSSYTNEKIPVSPETELAIVKGEKKLKGAIGSQGIEIAKGKATTEKTQNAYKDWIKQKKQEEKEKLKAKELEEQKQKMQQEQIAAQPVINEQKIAKQEKAQQKQVKQTTDTQTTNTENRGWLSILTNGNRSYSWEVDINGCPADSTPAKDKIPNGYFATVEDAYDWAYSKFKDPDYEKYTGFRVPYENFTIDGCIYTLRYVEWY